TRPSSGSSSCLIHRMTTVDPRVPAPPGLPSSLFLRKSQTRTPSEPENDFIEQIMMWG
ncbi:hypothetical protein H0H93_005239, partial [Arthromyces matolae]